MRENIYTSPPKFINVPMFPQWKKLESKEIYTTQHDGIYCEVTKHRTTGYIFWRVDKNAKSHADHITEGEWQLIQNDIDAWLISSRL